MELPWHGAQRDSGALWLGSRAGTSSVLSQAPGSSAVVASDVAMELTKTGSSDPVDHPMERKSARRPPGFTRLMKLLRRRGRSQEDAEDLIQEAFLRLTEYCRAGEVHNEVGFLQRTVINLSIDRHRAASRHPIAGQSVEELAEVLPLVDAAPAPDDVLGVQQRLNEVRSVLGAISPRTRDIYLACRAGYRYEELAAAFGVSVSTIEKSVARAVVAIMEMRDSK